MLLAPCPQCGGPMRLAVVVPHPLHLHEDATYRERYQSVVEAIKQCCVNGVYWDEPTSFFLFENPSEAQVIANWIQANSGFSPDRDLLLVMNQSAKSYGVVGRVKNLATLKALMAKM